MNQRNAFYDWPIENNGTLSEEAKFTIKFSHWNRKKTDKIFLNYVKPRSDFILYKS